MKLDLTEEKRRRLLEAHIKLKLWPDAADALRKLRQVGVKIITISNFTPKMIEANAARSGITDLFDHLISTETNKTYKPYPHAYELGLTALHLKKSEILFVAFGGWDAYGAKSFGYPTYWINPFNLPEERLGVHPDRTSNSLEDLLKFVLGPG